MLGIPASRRDFLLLLLLLFSSGNPAFSVPYVPNATVPTIIIGLMSITVAAKDRVWLSKSDFVVLLSFALLLGVQALQFGNFPILTWAGFFGRIAIGLIIGCLVTSWVNAYCAAILWLSVVSLCVYIPTLMLGLAGISIQEILQPHNLAVNDILDELGGAHLFIHNFNTALDAHRNSGIFWEPGALSGYCILGLLLVSKLRGHLSNRTYGAYLIILSITVASTLSTLGYVLLPIALAMNFSLGRDSKAAAVQRLIFAAVATPLVAFTFYFAIIDLPFMQEKFEQQFSDALIKREGSEITRVGAAIFNREYIEQKPLVGWGLLDETRFALDPSADVVVVRAQGNGLIDFIVRFGFVGIAIFAIAAYAGLRRQGFHIVKAGMLVGLIVISLNGEAFLNYPLYLSLMFLKRPRYQSADSQAIARAPRWKVAT